MLYEVEVKTNDIFLIEANNKHNAKQKTINSILSSIDPKNYKDRSIARLGKPYIYTIKELKRL